MEAFCSGADGEGGREVLDGGPPPAVSGGGSVMAHQVKKKGLQQGVSVPERIVKVVRGEGRVEQAKGEQVQKGAHLGGNESVGWQQVGVRESVPKEFALRQGKKAKQACAVSGGGGAAGVAGVCFGLDKKGNKAMQASAVVGDVPRARKSMAKQARAVALPSGEAALAMRQLAAAEVKVDAAYAAVRAAGYAVILDSAAAARRASVLAGALAVACRGLKECAVECAVEKGKCFEVVREGK